MIYQISDIKTKTAKLPRIQTELIQASEIPLLEESLIESERGRFWSPITAGPYLVPVSRWVE